MPHHEFSARNNKKYYNNHHQNHNPHHQHHHQPHHQHAHHQHHQHRAIHSADQMASKGILAFTHHQMKGIIVGTHHQHQLCPPLSITAPEESPFDNVLKGNDYNRARTLVSLPEFLSTYPPRLTLHEFVATKSGDDGFSETLCLLIESGVYNVTADFIVHVLLNFSTENILTVLNSIKYEYIGESKKVMHMALRRSTRPKVPAEVSLNIIKKLLDLGFNLNSLDDFNQSAIFYFIQGEDEIWNYTPVHSSSDLSGHGDDDQGSYYRSSKNFYESNYKFNLVIWNFLMEKKVKVNLIDKFNESPLSLAVKLHRNEIIIKLLTNNSVDIRLPVDQPPFCTYCEEGILSEDVFRIFLTRVFVEKYYSITNFEDKTPLHCLLNNQLGQEDVFALVPYVKQFLGFRDEESFLAKQDSLGHTPLMTAICQGYPIEILKLLIPREEVKAKSVLSLLDKSGLNSLSLALLRYQRVGPSSSRERGSNFAAPFEFSYSRSQVNSTPATSSNATALTSTSTSTSTTTTTTTATTKTTIVRRPTRGVTNQKFVKDRPSFLQLAQVPPSDPEYTLHKFIEIFAFFSTGSAKMRLHKFIPRIGATKLTVSDRKAISDGKADPFLLYDDENLSESDADSDREVDKGNSLPVPIKIHLPLCEESAILNVIKNKHISWRAFRLLLYKGLVEEITCSDIGSCLAHFRLDLLDEILEYLSYYYSRLPQLDPKEGQKIEQLHKSISACPNSAVQILDNVFKNRHLYLSATTNLNVQQRRRSSGSSFNGSINACTYPSNCLLMPNLNENNFPVISQELAIENLDRVLPLLKKLFDHFNHDINFVSPVKEKNEDVDSITVIHALIQANSWLPNQAVVDYILGEKGPQLNVEISLEGRGTPLNYAIRLGQYYIAEKLLDLNADVKSVDLKIPVLPLKKGFSNTIRRMVKRGATIPPEFGQQIASRIGDPSVDLEFKTLMSEMNFY